MKWILPLAAVLGCLSVALAAYFRHAGGGDVSGSLDIALRYHQLYSIVLLVLGLAVLHMDHAAWRKVMAVSAALFSAGIIIFSGSLYIAHLTGSNQYGMATPLGGVMLMAGWLAAGFLPFASRGAKSV